LELAAIERVLALKEQARRDIDQNRERIGHQAALRLDRFFQNSGVGTSLARK
jgi:hypothetical protein